MPRPLHQNSRRGTLLVVVLGMITIFLALMLAITIRVYNSTKNGTAFQQTVQAFLMMEAAKMYIMQSGGAVTNGDTIGDGVGPTPITITNRPYGGQMGWFHFKNNSSPYFVVAAGGSSAAGAAKTAADINSGDPIRNAYEVRLYYKITGTASPLTVELQPVANNSTYW